MKGPTRSLAVVCLMLTLTACGRSSAVSDCSTDGNSCSAAEDSDGGGGAPRHKHKTHFYFLRHRHHHHHSTHSGGNSCADGTVSHAAHRQGMCSHHGGLAD